jgi:hypothetical protein
MTFGHYVHEGITFVAAVTVLSIINKQQGKLHFLGALKT